MGGLADGIDPEKAIHVAITMIRRRGMDYIRILKMFRC